MEIQADLFENLVLLILRVFDDQQDFPALRIGRQQKCSEVSQKIAFGAYLLVDFEFSGQEIEESIDADPRLPQDRGCDFAGDDLQKAPQQDAFSRALISQQEQNAFAIFDPDLEVRQGFELFVAKPNEAPVRDALKRWGDQAEVMDVAEVLVHGFSDGCGRS